VPDRGEHALDRIGCAQVIPVLMLVAKSAADQAA
jgi:hypothetical protein